MSAAYKGPLDYIDVASRIVEFRKNHPEGSLTRIAPDGQLVPLQFLEFAGKTWVVYTAFAYRTPDDRFPGVGTAWEPVPGPTQFTRDSEVQNAETAAWGRAMVAALSADTKKGIASSEEVRNRQAPAKKPPTKTRVTEALTAINDAIDLAHLDGVWRRVQAGGLDGVAELKAAYDTQAKALVGTQEPPLVDEWAVKEVPA